MKGLECKIGRWREQEDEHDHAKIRDEREPVCAIDECLAFVKICPWKMVEMQHITGSEKGMIQEIHQIT